MEKAKKTGQQLLLEICQQEAAWVEAGGSTWEELLERILDVNYIVDYKGDYLGARLCVATGGPGIWINTKTQQVEGYWWNDRATCDYRDDAQGLDDYYEELWYNIKCR